MPVEISLKLHLLILGMILPIACLGSIPSKRWNEFYNPQYRQNNVFTVVTGNVIESRFQKDGMQIYDTAGFLIKEIRFVEGKITAVSRRYIYSSDRLQITEVNDLKPDTIAYHFDSLKRLVKQRTSDGKVIQEWEFEYRPSTDQREQRMVMRSYFSYAARNEKGEWRTSVYKTPPEKFVFTLQSEPSAGTTYKLSFTDKQYPDSYDSTYDSLGRLMGYYTFIDDHTESRQYKYDETGRLAEERVYSANAFRGGGCYEAMTRPRPPVFIIKHQYDRHGLLRKSVRYTELGRRYGLVWRIAWRFSLDGLMPEKERKLKYQNSLYYAYDTKGLLTEESTCRNICMRKQYHYTYYMPDSR